MAIVIVVFENCYIIISRHVPFLKGLLQIWYFPVHVYYKNNTGIKIPIDDSGRNGYAYTWWTNDVSGGGKRSTVFQAAGWGGQEIIILPELNMTVVFTGGNYVVKKHYYEILERFVLPALDWDQAVLYIMLPARIQIRSRSVSRLSLPHLIPEEKCRKGRFPCGYWFV